MVWPICQAAVHRAGGCPQAAVSGWCRHGRVARLFGMTEPATRPAIEPDTGRAAGPDTGPAAGARVLVRSPGELVAVTPYLLGFHPTDSLVLIALPATGNSVQVTVRADLT